MPLLSTNPLVAVMMPVYNGEKTIELAVKSLLHQTYENWVCYIVNDGSTDGTRLYLDSLKDDRFKVIHFEKNQGRPYARQAALDAAEGDFLAFLDADDFFHPEKLEKQIRLFLENPDLDLVSCGMGSYDGKFELLKVRGANPAKTDCVRQVEVAGKYDAPHAPSIVRLHLAKAITYNKSMKLAQDTDFFIRYLDGRKYMIAGEVLYYYSEFVSVTGKKILKTNLLIINRNMALLAKTPVVAAKTILVALLKTLIMFFLLPFTGTEFFVNRRGINPTIAQLAEFNRVRRLFNILQGQEKY
ncbi:glycosyltransferase family 2 protein [Desertivirga arenae]|uniref:glycosyltransferase family 2 protein n=1 Tax=Desertivirga arenae TaxID=2810309 RepID=UPI001A9756A1|nr:glycosyltransferase family 2 protein [Pedobacter sp. SYSU D00823]